MRLCRIGLAALTVLAGGQAVWGGEGPNIGYAYPAGGRQGTTFPMLIGGQYLDGATNVVVSGEGISIQVEKYSVRYEPRVLRQLFRNLENWSATLEEKDESEQKERDRLERQIARITAQLQIAERPDGVDPMDKKEVLKHYRFDQKEQFNPQLADRLRVRVTIAENAPPGERELRVVTKAGLSNPFYFQVGVLEEVSETEPNDDHMSPELQALTVPCLINGQVRPGDIDHFRFDALKGDSIVVDVHARRIIPYLADAVPGWFQAVVALYDEDGKEVAYQDDYKFHPDPVLFFDVPEAGTYTLSIRDSIYRGREDFVYRIALGELPFITGIFPLGARRGESIDIALSGRNLPKNRLSGKMPAEEGMELRHITVRKDGYRSNPMPFAIGSMAETFESEPNDAQSDAQPVVKPVVINGRIQQVGDRDVFSFEGQAGDAIAVEVVARRLNSPLDSVLTLTGPGLEQAVRNDDYVNKDKTHLHLGAGLVTHHADSYLLHTLPATGTYSIEIEDAQTKGGHDYGYRLRIADASPDYRLLMEPSGLHIAPGGTAAFSVRALRQEGFDGEILLEPSRLPDGFTMSEAVIPRGSDMTRFTITAPREIGGNMFKPEIVGVAMINGADVIHPAIPVDDQMQAFLYRHLVPAGELVLAPAADRPPLSFEARMPKSGFVEVAIGEQAHILFKGRLHTKGVALKLDNPPEGLTGKEGWLWRDKKIKNGAAGRIYLNAADPLKPGDQFSLVVAAEVRRGKETKRYYAPAIPVRIVEPSP